MDPFLTMKKVWPPVKRGITIILISLGTILLIAIILSFTDYPYYAHRWLANHNTQLDVDPDIIILLGGTGMPSADGLLRTYFTSGIGNKYPKAKIIIAMPADTGLHDKSPELLMAHELIIRGIDSLRIKYEKEGFSTYSQAKNIASMLGDETVANKSMQIVTSPEHMFRAVATFRKAGFKFIGGRPAFEHVLPEEQLIDGTLPNELRDREARKLNLRYNMWNYLKYEIIVLREYCAIVYYKLRGWI
ncbi:MAG: YdcF family protein [Bacteroidales bacterium]|nr:YdcF family protein [Bacteroidales bacterium]